MNLIEGFFKLIGEILASIFLLIVSIIVGIFAFILSILYTTLFLIKYFKSKFIS